MPNETFELDIYKSILDKLNSNESTYEEWIVALREVLDEAIKKFKPVCRATYCIYTVNSETNLIHLEAAGANNSEYLLKRTGSKDTSISSGYIGKAINSKYAYTCYNNINDVSGYVCGNPDTRSELVVKIHSLLSNTLIGIINLEANKEDAFDGRDGLLFSMIANWAGQFHAKKENELKKNKILNYVSSLLFNYPLERSSYRRREEVFSKLSQIFHDIAKSNAVAIVMYETRFRDYNVLFQINYPKIENKDRENSVPIRAIIKHQTSTETIGEPTIQEWVLVEHPYLIESKICENLNYFLSVCFSYDFEDTRNYAAIILGFQDINIKIKNTTNFELKFLAKITSEVIKKTEQIDDRELLVSAINSLYSNHAIDVNMDIDVYWKTAAFQLRNSINSTGCVFYLLINENSGLQDIGNDFGVESNIFWAEQFTAHIDKLKKIEPGENNYIQFLMTTKLKKYNVYARSIELHQKAIFVSFKQLQDYHGDIKISEIHRTILNVKIKFIESFVKDWLRGNSIDYSLEGFRKVISIWLQKVVMDSSDDCESVLFKSVHEFLKDWSQVAGTRYSAIFLLSETTLKISKTSMDHIGATEKGMAPLQLNISETNGKIGLTQKVWKNRESLLSFSILSEGNKECRDFWQKIVQSDPDSRFFAGVIIKNNESALGVLTINGPIPAADAKKLSMEPSILPMLEVIAEELGKQIYWIRSKLRQ